MARDDTDAAVRLTQVRHAFGRGEFRRDILHGIDLVVGRGEIVFLMGPSGCGKTTILTLVGALRSVQGGSVRVLGDELAGASPAQMIATRRRIGFVFQNHNLHRSLTALQNVRMGLEALGLPASRDDDRRCLDMLDIVGLRDHAHKHQDKLSGGQRQRVAIARALVGAPHLLLADEPTAALDKTTGFAAIGLMRSIAKERGMSVLMVTHDNRILSLADRIIEMDDGRILPGTPEHPVPALAAE
jgi:putative ABC transport system ATP-binding protein